MFTAQELEELFIGLCLEGFFYGKISIPCALTCTLAKEVQLELFSILGLYSAIFVIYLQCVSERSGTSGPIILFYALCLLYFVSTVAIVGDIVNLILQVSNNSIFKNILFFQLCSFVSVNYHFNFKTTQSQCYCALGLSKPQRAVVPTSSPNVSWYI